MQELEYVKVTKRERLREASEAKKGLRREIERIKDEHSNRLRQLTDERDRLQKQVDSSQSSSPDVSKVSKFFFFLTLGHKYVVSKWKETLHCSSSKADSTKQKPLRQKS